MRGRSMDTKAVYAGNVKIGGGARVTVQSMTNTDTRDAGATISQIRALADAGAEIVRVSVYDETCAQNVRALVDESPVPLVADIHFDHRLAIEAVENGIAKVRINPGNIGGEKNVRALADCLRAHRVPVRIGVNAGSLERDIFQRYGGVTAEGMVESGLDHARMLERAGWDEIVLSFKASTVRLTVDACRLAADARITRSTSASPRRAHTKAPSSKAPWASARFSGRRRRHHPRFHYGRPRARGRGRSGHTARGGAAPGLRRGRLLSHLRPHRH